MYLRKTGSNPEQVSDVSPIPFETPQWQRAGFEWVTGQPPETAIPVMNPLEAITMAIKALPVAKRTNAAWGGFISQCLLSIQNQDFEALGYLINNYQTQDSDYNSIITQAKQLFGV